MDDAATVIAQLKEEVRILRQRTVQLEADNAEHKQIADALHLSEARFRLLVEQSPLSTQILAPDGSTVQVNHAWETLWGVTLEQIRDYNILDDPQLVAKGVMPYVQRAFAGEAVAIPPILYNPDETLPDRTHNPDPERWVRAFIYPVIDQAGRVREVVLIHEDITERQSAEQALRESEQRYRTLFESIDQGFCVIEVLFDDHDTPCDYRFLEVNPAFEYQTGLAQAVGKRMRELAPQHEPHWFDIYGKIAMTGEPVRFEQRADALNRWFDVYAFRLGEASSHRVAVLFNDITARKRAEASQRASEERQLFLLRLTDALRPLADPIAIQDVAARLLGEHLQANRVGYAEDQGDGATIGITRTYTAGMPSIEGCYRYDDDPTFLQAFTAGRTVVRPDIAGDPTLTDAEKAAHAVLQLGASVDVPLVKAGRLLAVLFVHYREAHAWSPDDVALIEETAERTWAAVERARAEAAVRASEARFRLMADAVPESIWITDAAGRAEFLNKQWCDYCGVPYEPTTAAEIATRFLHPDDAPRVMAAFGEAMRTGTPFEIEQRNRSAAGEYRWFLNRANPYRDPETGEISRWFGVGIDIHDRKRAEAAARESEARFRAVADLVPDLLWSSDPCGALDWYNQRWFDYTGQTLEQAHGNGWLDVIHPDDRQCSLQSLQTALGRGAPLRQEQRMRGVEGGYRWFLVQAHPLRDATGRIVRWYGAATDVHTERLALEAAQAARAEVEAALQARDDFLSMVSHDLKQPLGVIKAYAELVQRRLRRADPPTVAQIGDSLGKIEGAASRMTRFINELLDAVRLPAGQPLDLEINTIDLLALVRRVVAEQQQTTERHRLHITTRLPELVGDYDAARLERVLANLLSNAIKYSPEGGAIDISVAMEGDDHAGWGVIQVRDAGLGIPAADLPYIFERFRRASNVVGQIGGSGIGLASAQQIVEQHGGTIVVESVEGQGSSFIVRLPWASRMDP